MTDFWFHLIIPVVVIIIAVKLFSKFLFNHNEKYDRLDDTLKNIRVSLDNINKTLTTLSESHSIKAESGKKADAVNENAEELSGGTAITENMPITSTNAEPTPIPIVPNEIPEIIDEPITQKLPETDVKSIFSSAEEVKSAEPAATETTEDAQFQDSPPPPVPEQPEPKPFAEKREPGWMAKLFGLIGDWVMMRGKFTQPNVTWEYAMATNWLLRFGIGLVLIGVAYFLKWSISNGLMAPSVRVTLTLVCGISLVVAGARMLGKRYDLLAQGMCATGFTLMYFGFFAAYGMYHLMSARSAAIMWVCITIGIGFFSIQTKSIFIALLGLVGGYLTPVLLGANNDSYLMFYFYLTLLALGVLAVSIIRTWPSLNFISMLAGYALAIGYTLKQPNAGKAFLYAGTVFFTIQHLVYLAGTCVCSTGKAAPANKVAVQWLNSIGMCANAAVYAIWLMVYFRQAAGMEPVGLIFLGVVALYILLLRANLKYHWFEPVQANIVMVHTIAFLALSPVMILGWSWLTFAWCVQIMAMEWLSKKLRIPLLHYLAAGLLLVVCCRVIMADIYQLYLVVRPWTIPAADKFLAELALRMVKLGIVPITFIFMMKNAEKSETRNVFYIISVALSMIYSIVEGCVIAERFTPGFTFGSVTLVLTFYAIGFMWYGIAKARVKCRRFSLILFAVVTAKLLLLDLHGLDTGYRIVASTLVGLLLVCGSALYLKYRAKFERED